MAKCATRRASSLAVAAVLLVLAIASYPYARVNVDRQAVALGTLSPEQSRQLLLSLLKNVYRAFDFREEEVVYDKLALSVSGDLLADIYLQSRKSFAIQKAGGAQAKIKSVEVLEARAERRNVDALEYALRATWTAAGRVGHWGHVHTRQNRYDGEVTVRAVNGRWKITGLELLEETRIDPASDGAVSQASRPAPESL